VNAGTEGFARFVEARQRALQRTAWRLTGDRALAEDLVQTALARSWPRWERIRRRDDPEVYIRRVMVNTWASWSRRRWQGERPSAAVKANYGHSRAVRPQAGSRQIRTMLSGRRTENRPDGDACARICRTSLS
jgi:DNA-directed RNA polymerase specialized sigma24 family protein